jgi:hypothetical protein
MDAINLEPECLTKTTHIRFPKNWKTRQKAKEVKIIRCRESWPKVPRD